MFPEWRDTAKSILGWAELIAAAGIIAAAVSGAIGIDPKFKTMISIALPAVVVALRLIRVF